MGGQSEPHISELTRIFLCLYIYLSGGLQSAHAQRGRG